MKLFLTIVVAMLSCAACSEKTSDELAIKAADVAIQYAEIDASAFDGVSERMKEKCDGNKFGLSEDECINKINANKEGCIKKMAEVFSGPIDNTERLQEVGVSFGRCLFPT